ncbi:MULTISPECIES: acyl-CoA dehydrogenase family protein [unclassified Variovorax]|uniref:acyl-CoA dehydrogenase family protein n=1 Tax=unclassified Variovorax TaxID=663243 RepID=UPI00076CF475|nr:MULTISPECIES: acyl-CoA dehydrogenase family protein [unclassified Variovorax]KWT74686.1 Acyl-CoA dehydrogenase [Variovorax sp. WDL1]PNG53070.1 3-methylmercaptopropionyl-CoA dehydrogenase [Variovorax sp. B2]PNG53642.1 3-methylmercaptopropionyl-CoA dehydrogenase [Variovorax sp. B4]VTV11078.1 Acyl-CoA dehydrogenase [Variovorax sp. WDL1]
MNYQPHPDDQRFLLDAVLGATPRLRALGPFAEFDDALQAQVLDEAGKFVAEVVAPLNRIGDETGCRLANGEVLTPPGFREAYQGLVDGGWLALSAAPEDGGQGLPAVLEAILFEWLSAANHGLTMAPGLLHGAYECLRHHGSAELQQAYLPKIASGEWLATMCLTEAHAGSDLGQVRTRALPQSDGSLRVSGSKIFISGGEHDLTPNIVHLVLCRLPGAPAGPKGLSLALVPKLLPDGIRNPVHCERIEEKMGLHGSPTCAMRFDEATGWLVGEPNRGLAAMFVMMNAARLHVALQGIGLLDAAWQKADAYGRERRQMRAPGPAPASRGTEAADLIVEHPAVRRILETQRAWIDGARLLAYRSALQLDIARHDADPARRERAERWCALITPVLKAACTQQAFEGASACLQVFGGHGYVREWGIEQVLRDARVTMIYEGTNEIQAIDLVVRKLVPDGGAGMASLLIELRDELDAAREFDAEVQRRFAQLRYLGTTIALAAQRDPALPHEVADDYLRVVALSLLAWAWARIAHAAPETSRWTAPAAAFRRYVLPEFDMRLGMVKRACEAVMSPDAAA